MRRYSGIFFSHSSFAGTATRKQHESDTGYSQWFPDVHEFVDVLMEWLDCNNDDGLPYEDTCVWWWRNRGSRPSGRSRSPDAAAALVTIPDGRFSNRFSEHMCKHSRLTFVSTDRHWAYTATHQTSVPVCQVWFFFTCISYICGMLRLLAGNPGHKGLRILLTRCSITMVM